MTLNEQVEAKRQTEIRSKMNVTAGKAEGDFKQDHAADNKSAMLKIAQKIALDMGEKGPVTIDDVTEEMAKRYNVAPAKGKRVHQWKGSVFNGSEWVYIHQIPSRITCAHARPIGVWARKSWLGKNSMNGKESAISAFVVSRIYKDYMHRVGTITEPDRYQWVIGLDALHTEVMDAIKRDSMRLYGVPVKLVSGMVGAILASKISLTA